MTTTPITTIIFNLYAIPEVATELSDKLKRDIEGLKSGATHSQDQIRKVFSKFIGEFESRVFPALKKDEKKLRTEINKELRHLESGAADRETMTKSLEKDQQKVIDMLSQAEKDMAEAEQLVADMAANR